MRTWLEEHPVAAYAIIDDDFSWSAQHADLRRVHVVPSADHGIVDAHVHAAIAHLGAIELTPQQERQVAHLRSRWAGEFMWPSGPKMVAHYRELVDTGLVRESEAAGPPSFSLTVAGLRWAGRRAAMRAERAGAGR